MLSVTIIPRVIASPPVVEVPTTTGVVSWRLLCELIVKVPFTFLTPPSKGTSSPD